MALVAAHVFNGEFPKRSQLVDGCVTEHRATGTGTLGTQSLVGQGHGGCFVFLAETDSQGGGRGGGGGGGRALKEVAAVAHGKEEERKWIKEMQMRTVLRNRCCENGVGARYKRKWCVIWSRRNCRSFLSLVG